MAPDLNHLRTLIEAALNAAAEGRGRRGSPSTWVVALSGGADSVALSHAVSQVVPSEQLILAHFNHRVRGVESDRDADFCREWAARLGVRFVEGSGPGSRSDENTLREERRKFLFDMVVNFSATAVMTAHHADDLLETILMRLIRGTGAWGLRGIPLWKSPWLRPWISVPQTSIQAWAKAHGLVHREDASNGSSRYFRNRVRHELVPVVRALAEPFGGSSALLSRTHALTTEIQALLPSSTQPNAPVVTEFWTRVSEAEWVQYSQFEKVQLLRSILSSSGKSLERVRVEKLFADLARPASGYRKHEIAGLWVERSCGFLYFCTPCSRREPDLHHQDTASMSKALHWKARYSLGYTVRFHRPGDKVSGKSVSRLWAEKGIPVPERRLLPLICRRDAPHVLLATDAWDSSVRRRDFEVEFSHFPWSFRTKAF